MSSKPAVIAILEKNKRERVCVALREYEGHQLVDLRVVVPLAKNLPALTPTKKGVAMNVDQIPALRQALAEAEAVARRRGWLKPSKKKVGE